MPNRAQIHEFYKNVKWRKCLYFKPEFGDLLGRLNKIEKTGPDMNTTKSVQECYNMNDLLVFRRYDKF